MPDGVGLQHGLKMTAMPAWSHAGVDDGTIWDLVALVQKLPAMRPQEYDALVKASAGHTHGAEQREEEVHDH